MKRGFFLKLARSNISKNRRFFLPRILSEAGLLCVFYIVFTLRTDERILQLRGGQYIEVFMSIGVAGMMLRMSRFAPSSASAPRYPVKGRRAASMASITHTPATNAAPHFVSKNRPRYPATFSFNVLRISADTD